MAVDARWNASRRSRALELIASAVLVFFLAACAGGGKEAEKIREVWLPVAQDEWKAAAVKGVTLYRTDKSVKRVVLASVVGNLLNAKGRLETAGSARAELALVDSEQPNAFAFVFGGRQVIAFSLPWLDRLGTDPDAIAAVMGHELAHVQLGHSGAERRKREKSAQETGHVAGVLLSIIGVPFGGMIAGSAATAYSRSFSRDEERAADDLGLKWATAAGFDPCGMKRVMDMYEGLDRVAPYAWLSTHPGNAERVETALRFAREAGGKECL
jgi:predicted Zn-dependent protease